jgi:tripartite-type tricarboxylate transporter receptor subunit TctC
MGSGVGELTLVVVALAVSSLFFPTSASARESYPNQSVRFVVAFAPGGPADFIARVVGARLTEKWGQGVIVEHRGGAGGNIAARQVAKAKPDGYTVLVTTSAYAVNPSLSANAGYSPQTDFKTAIVVATSPNIIVAAPGLKASTLKEVIQAAKTEKLTYGTAGRGVTPHLSAERIFKLVAKVDIAHVTFTGGAPALNALLGGHVNLVSVVLPPALELVRSGQIKALAVTSAKRLPSLPDVPTTAEEGFGDDVDATWVALILPAHTPVSVLAKLNADVNAVLSDMGIRQRLDKIGLTPVGGTLAEAEAYVQSEIVRWGDVVRKIGLRVE